MISAPGPAGKLPETPYGAIPHHIEPGWKDGSSGPHWSQDPSVEAWNVRVEALKAVYGGKAGLGIVEGENSPYTGAQSPAVALSGVGLRYAPDVWMTRSGLTDSMIIYSMYT